MASEADEASYRAVFELNPQPMWVCDEETLAVTAVNRAAAALYGYSSDEFLTLSLPQIVPEPGRHRRKDGTTFPALLTEQQISWGGKQGRLGVVSPSDEESERRERLLAECSARLEEAHKELESFSYSISHDLRAPLRHIDGFSKALLEDYGDKLDLQGQEYLNRICRSTESMSHLIDHLLKLVRVSRSEVQRQKVSLSVAAQVISLELKHASPERRVEFEIQEGVSVDNADPRLIRLLLENLIGNAWKFTGKNEEPRIEFARTEQGGETVYLVRDNGVGFDMAYADKLFTVFHRLHRTDEFEGCGIGLAIAQQIVRRHGGRIWAESAVGQGATFYFTLSGEVS